MCRPQLDNLDGFAMMCRARVGGLNPSAEIVLCSFKDDGRVIYRIYVGTNKLTGKLARQTLMCVEESESRSLKKCIYRRG